MDPSDNTDDQFIPDSSMVGDIDLVALERDFSVIKVRVDELEEIYHKHFGGWGWSSFHVSRGYLCVEWCDYENDPNGTEFPLSVLSMTDEEFEAYLIECKVELKKAKEERIIADRKKSQDELLQKKKTQFARLKFEFEGTPLPWPMHYKSPRWIIGCGKKQVEDATNVLDDVRCFECINSEDFALARKLESQEVKP